MANFDESLFDDINEPNLNDNSNPINSSSDNINPDDVFSKAVNSYFEKTPIDKSAITEKQTYKQFKQPIQTIQSEDNTTTKPIEDVEPEQGDFTWSDAWENFRQTVGTKTANFYDGLESLAINFGVERTRARAKAIGKAVELFTGQKFDTDKLDDILDNQKDEVKEALKVSTLVNDYMGFHYMNSIEDINRDYEKVEEKREQIDNIGLDAIHASAELFSELGIMKHAFSKSLWDTMFKKSMREITHKDIQKQALASATIHGTEKYSEEDYQLNPALRDATMTYLFTVAGGELIKGGGYAKDNILLNKAEKVTQGLEEHAVAETFGTVDKLNEWKQDMVDSSVYNTWDNVPHYLRQIWIMPYSQVGTAQARNISRNIETTGAMKYLAKASSEELDNIFKDVTELADKVYVASGMPVKKALKDKVGGASTTYAQRVLANSGLLKSAPMSSGMKPTNVNSADWDAYEAIIAGDYNANKDKLTKALKILGVQRQKDLEGLLHDSAGKIHYPKDIFVDDYIDGILQTMAKDMDKTGADLSPEAVARNFADEKEILTKSIEQVLGKNKNLDEAWEAKLAPKDVYDIRQALKQNADAHYGSKGLDATLNQSLDQAVIGSLEKEFGKDGKKFATTIRGILDIERERHNLIGKAGIKAIADNGHLMSPQEMQKAFYDMRNLSDDEWAKLVASLPTKEDQAKFEMYYLKAVTFKGHNNMQEMMDNLLHGGSKGASTGTKHTVSGRQGDILGRKLVTLQGRQMQHALAKLTQMTDHLTESLPTIGEDISYHTGIYKYVNHVFHNLILGTLQTKKASATNSAYVLNNMEKLMKVYGNRPALGATKESLYKGFAKGERTIDLDKFPTGLMTVQMLNNLRRLKDVEGTGKPPKGGGGTPSEPTLPTPPPNGLGGDIPTSPTPPPQPNPMPTPAPVSPQPMPMPKPTALPTPAVTSIMETGRINDQVVLMPVEKDAIEAYQDTILNKAMNTVLDDHSKGKLPNATLSSAEDWVAYNKELIKQQQGSGIKIILNPAGHPRVVVGQKGVGAWINEKALRSSIKGGQGDLALDELIDTKAMREYATKLGFPDMFDFSKLSVKMKETLELNRGGSQLRATVAGGKVSTKSIVNVGTKGKGDAPYDTLLRSINETLMHEVQHIIQSKLGLPIGTTSSSAEVRGELMHRVEELASVYKISSFDKSVVARIFEDENSGKVTDSEWKRFIRYNIDDHYPSPNQQGVRQVISENYGVSQDQLIHYLPENSYTLYRQSMGEAEAKFVEILARYQGADLSNEEVFDKFLQSNAEYLDALWTTNPDYKRLGAIIAPQQ